MSLIEHAERELAVAGYNDSDVDGYDTAIYNAVMDIVRLFASQGHSGFSAAAVRGLVNILLSFDTLGPLTNNPEEWRFIPEEMSGEPDGLWQNIRKSSAFSSDAGRTYWTLEDIEAHGSKDMVPLRVSEDYVRTSVSS
jgi:hypothetical protein